MPQSFQAGRSLVAAVYLTVEVEVVHLPRAHSGMAFLVRLVVAESGELVVAYPTQPQAAGAAQAALGQKQAGVVPGELPSLTEAVRHALFHFPIRYFASAMVRVAMATEARREVSATRSTEAVAGVL